MQGPGQGRTKAEIHAWLASQLEKELELPPGSIDTTKPLSRYGLDSIVAVGLSAELEDWLGCRLSPTILAEHASIAALASHLACDTGTPVVAQPAPTHSPGTPLAYAQPDGSAWSPLQSTMRGILAFLIKALCRQRIDGPGNFPASGPYLLAMNHLHVFDIPVVYAILPRPAVFFVSSHMKQFPVANWFLSHMANTIWVNRGEGDVQAMQAALAVLRSGGVVAVAPEGKISTNGGLLKGRTGTAYLATQADVPILPVVAYGQEMAFRYWLRLQRVPITLRIGTLARLPAGKSTAKQLETYTDTIMFSLAELLPGEYRGVYEMR